jgi:serine/threonine protein kinase/Tfp pilus assembly protein PilF
MKPERWERIDNLLQSALARMPQERSAFLAQACGDDELLRSEVESLIASHDDANNFLETPMSQIAADVLVKRHSGMAAGQKIGQYKIIDSIGAGGMGEVYLARDKKLDRNVAIKILNAEFSQDEANLQRFVSEAKAASALNHPNILTIYEFGEAEDARFIVSEYIEGKTLREIIRALGLRFPEILDIAIQITGALSAAHKAHLIHRDIKPENIMIRPDGYVKVLDFGLAKLIEQKNNSIFSSKEPTVRLNLTAKGVIVGTVNYMSPEQAKGERVDERTDIFSLGALIYEMLAGKPPFAGGNAIVTIGLILNKEPMPLKQQRPEVPQELERIINKALRKDPEERYQTAKDLLIDLKEVRQDFEFQNKLDRSAAPDHEGAKTEVFNAKALNSSSLQALSGHTQPENRTVAMGGGRNTTAENTGSRARWYRRWPVMAALGVILLGSIGLGGYFWRPRTGASNEIRSVAVMPFVNETGDPQLEYLSDGMTDTLISSLSELPNLKVKARTSIFRYKGKEIDPKTIGKELGVQAIVNGRVTQRDGRTNVLLEVVDAETEDVIFSTKYDRPQSALVTLQSDIARDVSGKLKSKLSGAEEAKVMKTHTADPEALQLYLQGQFYRYKGGRNNVLRATDYFNKAIEKDPNYSLAYAGLALNYRSYDLYNLVPDWQKASAAAKRALELDDSLAEAQLAAGHFRRAIELNPDYADAHVGLCINLTMTKRFDEGITECSKAHELDPSSAVVTTHLGAAYFFARRADEAIEMFTRAHEMDPTFWVPLGYLGGAQTLKGQYTEAAATFRKAIQISDGSPNAKSHLAYALAKAGQRHEALKLIDELKRLAEREHINSFHFAVPYIGLGDKDEAFFWLGKGVDEGSIGFAQLDIHPWFDDLRSDPRFTALLKRVKPPES